MYLHQLAWFLLPSSGMLPTTLAAVASRFTEPLSHPLAVLTAGFFSPGSFGEQAVWPVARVAWRLLHVLLAL